MATHDYVIANGTGAAVRSDLNGALAAIVSNNSSATEPATMYAYQWWSDTTTGLLKQRNAANSAWITIGTLASTNLGLLSLAGGTMTGVLAVTAGTAAAPSIAFTGDTNTGIYSPGADQLAISTGGTGRITVDASGNVNIDSNTLYVDAVNNRVGVGTPSPESSLQLGGTTNKSIRIDSSTTNSCYFGIYEDSAQITINRDGATGTFTNTAKSAATLLLNGGSGGSYIEFATAAANNTSPTPCARLDSSGRLLVGGSTDSGGALLQVFGDRIRIGTAKTPASASATGTTGEICWDASYIYVCTATNTWKRTAIATW